MTQLGVVLARVNCYRNWGSQVIDCSMVADVDWVVWQVRVVSEVGNTGIAHLMALRFAIQVRPATI